MTIYLYNNVTLDNDVKNLIILLFLAILSQIMIVNYTIVLYITTLKHIIPIMY